VAAWSEGRAQLIDDGALMVCANAKAADKQAGRGYDDRCSAESWT
jgi:hypothetical protein